MTTENLEKAELSYFSQKLRLEDNLLKKPFLNYNHHYTVYTLILCYLLHTTSVQFSLSVMSDSVTPWTAARPPCPLPTPRVYSNSCWVSDAIQSSCPLSSPSPAAFILSQHQGLFKWVSSSYQVAKVLEFQLQHQRFLLANVTLHLKMCVLFSNMILISNIISQG